MKALPSSTKVVFNTFNFAIKAQDSVITKTVKKHSQLTNFIKAFNKSCQDVPKDASWPKRKQWVKIMNITEIDIHKWMIIGLH